MKAPINERIIVLRYKRLADEVYRKTCDVLLGFLAKDLADESFVEERMNLPSVTLPIATLGSVEPDWAQLKVSIDRPSRFWNHNRTKCIQFYREYLTVNLIDDLEGKVLGSYKELCEFFVRLLPFFKLVDADLHVRRVGIDYQNILIGDQLVDFIKQDGEFLEVADIFRNDIVNVKISGTRALTPFRFETSYGQDPKQTARFPALLRVTINVPNRPKAGWQVYVLFSASADFPGFEGGHIVDFLDDMHASVTAGFMTTFSDKIVSRAVVKQ